MGYWERFRGRWRTIAYAARYGGQSIEGILGRRPTWTELQVFCTFVSEYLEIEKSEQLALFRPSQATAEDE